VIDKLVQTLNRERSSAVSSSLRLNVGFIRLSDQSLRALPLSGDTIHSSECCTRFVSVTHSPVSTTRSISLQVAPNSLFGVKTRPRIVNWFESESRRCRAWC